MHTATIEEQSIGTLLRQARLGYSLSLSDVSEALLIRKENLEYLEKDEFAKIPERLYRDQFLKNYTTYLGLEWSDIQACYEADESHGRKNDVSCSRHALQSSHFWVAPRIFKNVLLGSLMVGIISYLTFLGVAASHPPVLLVFSPPDNFSSTTDTVMVSGQTKEDAGISINGQAIQKSKDGTFHQAVNLQDGVNRIQVSATKKFGREQIVERKVIVTKSLIH